MLLKALGGRSDFFAIEGLPFAAVAFVCPETEPLLSEAVRRLRRSSDIDRGVLFVLVPPRPAPEQTDRDDGPVESFVVAGPPAMAILAGGDIPDPPLFSLLRDALGGRFGPVEVLSGDVAEREPGVLESIEGVLPHRGPDRFLAASAASLLQQPELASLAVGFDQPAPDELSLFGSRETVRLLAFHPQPVGPYVIRQHCALTSRYEFLAMQDSDDLSTLSRLARQLAHLRETEAAIVGCHELRVDEQRKTVRAHRYPLDANAALSSKPGYACLMGAMLIKTQTLRALGGFSTVRRIASDTQFLWRAHFSARIRNIDAFLYIRRGWPGSLTNAPQTAIGIPERAALRQAWMLAFASVQGGHAKCSETALVMERREDDVLVKDLRTGRIQAAVLS